MQKLNPGKPDKMAVKKEKAVKKKAEGKKNNKNKIVKAAKEVEEDDGGGLSLDDAFAGDEDVEYGEAKPRKVKKKKEEDDEEEEDSDDGDEEIANVPADDSIERDIQIKASKPIEKIKKGDKIKIDGREYEVDAHYVLIDHGSTKEMAIEIFDAKTDKDYQVRYFNDQAERTLDLYELDEIIYNKKPFLKIEW